MPTRQNTILTANASYANAVQGVAAAKSALEQAKAKRALLDAGPDNLDIYSAELSLKNAQESLKSAVARETALQRGVDTLDLQSQVLWRCAPRKSLSRRRSRK